MIKALVQSLESFLNYGTFVLFQDRRHKYKFSGQLLLLVLKETNHLLPQNNHHTREQSQISDTSSNPAFRDEQLLQTTWKQIALQCFMLGLFIFFQLF